MSRSIVIYLALLCYLPLVSAFSQWDRSLSIELLIGKLNSENPQERAIARQLLPTHPPLMVLPKIVPFLQSLNPDIRGIAKNVLLDLTNRIIHASKEERQQFAYQLLLFFEDSRLEISAREHILSALTLIIDEHVDITCLKKYLLDSEWREKVRVALVENGSDSARKILCESLEKLDDEGKNAILLGFTQVSNSPPCLDLIQQYLQVENESVQSASAFVLAHTGYPQYESLLYTVCKSTPTLKKSYTELWEAYIRLGENIIKRGGNWDLGINMYRKALAECSSVPIQTAAIIGLGRWGDDTVLPDLETILYDNQREYLHEAVCTAIKTLNTPVKGKWAVELCTKLPREKQILLLPTLIEYPSENAKGILESLFTDYPNQTKQVFIDNFFESTSLKYIDYIPFIESGLEEKEKRDLAECLWKVVSLHRSVEENEKPLIGKAYLYLLHLAPEDEKDLIWEGIKKYPSAEVVEKFLPEMVKRDITQLPFFMLFELYHSIPQEDKKKEEIHNLLMVRIKEKRAIHSIVGDISNSKYISSFPELVGFVTQWCLIGPFPWDLNNPFQENYGFPQTIQTKTPLTYKGKDYTWRTGVHTEGWGYIDLTSLCKESRTECSYVCAFAVTKIQVNEQVDSIFLIGTDDGYRLWVNQMEIAQKHVDRGMKVDEDSVEVHLNKGVNEILIQVTQIRGGWNFCLRITDMVGTPLQFTYAPYE